MKNYLKIIIRIVIKFILRCCFIIPLKHNRILFRSFEGAIGYMCSPKYISDYLKKSYGNKYELVWAFNNPETFADIDGIISVKYKSIKWLYYVITSKVIVINSIPPTFIPKRKSQLVIDTWHGGGAYKRVNNNRTDLNSYEKWSIKSSSKFISLFLSSSKEFTESSIKKGYLYNGEILDSGMPRNDLLFDKNKVTEIKNDLSKKYGLSGKLVLYAPTYRGKLTERERQEINLDFTRLLDNLEKLYNEKVFVLVRMHYLAVNEFKFVDDRMINVTSYPDMQELLCAADMLITDYSSSIWDYALLKKPCFLFVPDLDNYIQNDKGFLTPIEEWPGVICKSNDELIQAIIDLHISEYETRIDQYLDKMGSYEKGIATVQVVNYIVKHLDKGDSKCE